MARDSITVAGTVYYGKVGSTHTVLDGRRLNIQTQQHEFLWAVPPLADDGAYHTVQDPETSTSYQVCIRTQDSVLGLKHAPPRLIPCQQWPGETIPPLEMMEILVATDPINPLAAAAMETSRGDESVEEMDDTVQPAREPAAPTREQETDAPCATPAVEVDGGERARILGHAPQALLLPEPVATAQTNMPFPELGLPEPNFEQVRHMTAPAPSVAHAHARTADETLVTACIQRIKDAAIILMARDSKSEW